MYACFGSYETVLYGVNYTLDNWHRYGPEIGQEFPDVGQEKAEAAIRYLRDNFDSIARTSEKIKFSEKMD